MAYDPAYPRVSAWYAIDQSTSAVKSDEFYTYYPPLHIGAGRGQTEAESILNPVSGNASAMFQVTTSYSYDAMDRVLGRGITYPTVPQSPPSHNVEFPQTLTYDGLGRVTQDSTYLETYNYAYADATRRVAQRTAVATGHTETFAYFPSSGDGLLQNITYNGPGGQVANFNYQYDPNHNITSVSSMIAGAPQNVNNTYDGTNQLLTSGTPSAPESYAYDPAGNIMTFNASPSGGKYGGSYGPPSYSGVDEPRTFNTPSGPQNVTFDTSGHMTAVGQQPYTYDGFGRLTSAVNSGNGSLFTYDGLGRLIQVRDLTANQTYNANTFYDLVWPETMHSVRVACNQIPTESPRTPLSTLHRGFVQKFGALGRDGRLPVRYGYPWQCACRREWRCAKPHGGGGNELRCAWKPDQCDQ